MMRDHELKGAAMENCTTEQLKELMNPGEIVGELSDRLQALQDRLELYPPQYLTVDNLFMMAALSLETLSHELWQLQKKGESWSGSSAKNAEAE
jgi:hypothetical protein